MTTEERIFALLKERNVKQGEFAKSIEVSSGHVTDWKTGRSKPKTEVLIKIAKYFNVSLDYLLGLTDDTPAPPPIPDDLRDVAFAFHGGVDTDGLDEDDIEELESFLKYLKNRKKK